MMRVPVFSCEWDFTHLHLSPSTLKMSCSVLEAIMLPFRQLMFIGSVTFSHFLALFVSDHSGRESALIQAVPLLSSV